MIITVARKPLVGSIVSNALTEQGGCLNIDACRIGAGTVKQATAGNRTIQWGIGEGGCSYQKGVGAVFSTEGRWPANLMHDGSAYILLGFPQTGSSKPRVERNSGRQDESEYRIKPVPGVLKDFGDKGSAARFFKQVNTQPTTTSELG